MRKTLKHVAWFSIALITGFTFVGYFVPMKQLVIDFFTFNSSFWPVFWVMFFAICTYGNAGWMRSISVFTCVLTRASSLLCSTKTPSLSATIPNAVKNEGRAHVRLIQNNLAWATVSTVICVCRSAYRHRYSRRLVI